MAGFAVKWITALVACLIPMNFAHSLERNGKIVQIEENHVAVEVESGNLFRVGQQIELSCMAGLMEMLLGRYEVYQSKGNFFAAREISVSIPPSLDMKVRIVPAKDFVISPDPGAMDPPDRDPRFLPGIGGMPPGNSGKIEIRP